jgi:hypothetical protein
VDGILGPTEQLVLAHTPDAVQEVTAQTSDPSSSTRLTVDLSQLNLIKGTASSWKAPVTITDRSRIKSLLAAVCRLPAIPDHFAFSSCPPDTQLTYQLDFDRGYEVLGEAVAHVTGCRLVTGIFPIRMTELAFWRTLHREVPKRSRLVNYKA